MRVVAYITCVALSLGVLGAPPALAQGTGVPNALSLSPTERQSARPQTPRSSRPAFTASPAPTSAPATFDYVSRLGDHLQAVRWELAIVGAAFAVVGIKDW